MFKTWWHPKKHTKLEIFMKSGNIIEIDGILEWKITTNINPQLGVEAFHLHQSAWAKYKLIISTIDLSQIEAVVSL